MTDADTDDLIADLKGDIGDLEEQVKALEGNNTDLRDELRRARSALDEITDIARLWESRR